MRKFISLMMFMTAVFAFTSCTTEDQNEAMTLTGTWQGDLGIYMYSDRYNDYYEAYQTTIQFNSSGYGSTSGTGYELDRFQNAPWNYIYNPIQWSVTDGTIYIYYPREKMTLRIFDYYLSDKYFSGRMEDGTDFHLTYVGNFDWSPYNNDYYNAKTRNTSVDMSKYIFGCKHSKN